MSWCRYAIVYIQCNMIQLCLDVGILLYIYNIIKDMTTIIFNPRNVLPFSVCKYTSCYEKTSTEKF